jgi:hypothetical protein
MSELAHDLLMIEFLSWIASRPRTYSETMEAWQSTCPRHTIWEDAVIGGYVQVSRDSGVRDPAISLTDSGFALLSGKNGFETR